eukprot:gnl/TRDRNA2_/TRDRNA2_29382_c0_seq1.p2 gnl/TRDRNA2_/TRDRNA2_29382_c0~~gnl/TRDRNA2_/TRDRNA2_29382_c0_seq1.p2  ORF type:complete len:104 (+),score=14.94 gnl/TRDRNA2_/TRDRNA2_29382_c0_seq1:20-331(+)
MSKSCGYASTLASSSEQARVLAASRACSAKLWSVDIGKKAFTSSMATTAAALLFVSSNDASMPRSSQWPWKKWQSCGKLVQVLGCFGGQDEPVCSAVLSADFA